MYSIDALGELLVDALALVGSVLFAGAGLRTELLGIEHVATGDLTVGAWMALMGGVALFVGVYLLGYREVLPRLRRRLGAGG